MGPDREDLALEYRLNLRARLARIEELRGALASGAAPLGQVADLLRDLHSIAGSAQVFGLPAVSDAARAAERYVAEHCSGSTPPDAARWAELRALLERLQLLFERRA